MVQTHTTATHNTTRDNVSITLYTPRSAPEAHRPKWASKERNWPFHTMPKRRVALQKLIAAGAYFAMCLRVLHLSIATNSRSLSLSDRKLTHTFIVRLIPCKQVQVIQVRLVANLLHGSTCRCDRRRGHRLPPSLANSLMRHAV